MTKNQLITELILVSESLAKYCLCQLADIISKVAVIFNICQLMLANLNSTDPPHFNFLNLQTVFFLQWFEHTAPNEQSEDLILHVLFVHFPSSFHPAMHTSGVSHQDID